ncbi:MAG: YihY/virulence factor BrkB family protein [Polyangiaceae bacterium]|nr:YihY/virulence factor BrkB family protein [Polyangiaceae bacterium]
MATVGESTLFSRAGARVEGFFARSAFLRFSYSLAHGMNRDGVAVHASAMAFDLFLSLIPLLALAGWALAALLRESPEALQFVSALMDSTPIQVHLILQTHFGRFKGGIAPLAAVVAVYMASNAFHTFMQVFENATGASRRSWWWKRLIALACVFVCILALGASGVVAVALAGGPARTLEAVLRPAGVPLHTQYIAYVTGAAIGTVFLAGFFRIAVNHPNRKRHVWRGATLTVVLGVLVSWGFAQYLRTLARYTLYYGSLATVAMTLFWVYLWCVALLVGMELNAQLEQEERRRMPRPSQHPPPAEGPARPRRRPRRPPARRATGQPSPDR